MAFSCGGACQSNFRTYLSVSEEKGSCASVSACSCAFAFADSLGGGVVARHRAAAGGKPGSGRPSNTPREASAAPRVGVAAAAAAQRPAGASEGPRERRSSPHLRAAWRRACRSPATTARPANHVRKRPGCLQARTLNITSHKRGTVTSPATYLPPLDSVTQVPARGPRAAAARLCLPSFSFRTLAPGWSFLHAGGYISIA